MNMNAIKRSGKAMGGLAIIAVIALFMFAFMFSKPVITGLITGNDSLNISENIGLDNISIEDEITEGLEFEGSDNVSLNVSIKEDIIENLEELSEDVNGNITELNISENLSYDINQTINLTGQNITEIITEVNESVEDENESMYVVLNLNIKNISEEISDVNLSISIKSKITKVTEKVVGRVKINSPVKFVKRIKLTGAALYPPA